MKTEKINIEFVLGTLFFFNLYTLQPFENVDYEGIHVISN
jgi:hypothetical protein